MKRRSCLALAVGGAGWLTLGPARAAPAAKGEPVNWPATLRLLDGSMLDAGMLRGTATVVVFFSTTCPYCERHNQHLQALSKSAAGLRVMGAAHERDAERVRRHQAARGQTFAVTLDHQPLHEALSLRRVTPLTCVVDAQGRLREVIPGEMTLDDVMELARWARA
jgi:thiol-disulfide isomerase/thioredoxin